MQALAAGEPAAASSPAATQPQELALRLSPLLMSVLAAGVCVLIVYGIHRSARPDKLRLASAPMRPNRLHPLHVLGVFLALALVGRGVASVPMDRLGLDETRGRVLGVVVVQALWLAMSLGVARLTFPLGLRRGLGLSARHWFLDGLRGGAAYLAVLPVVVLLLWAMTLLPGAPVHPMIDAMPKVSAGWKAVVFLSAGLLAPLCEEVFFRGLVQSMFRRYFRGAWPGLLLASAWFAVSHVDGEGKGVHWVPPLFALGVVLGYNYERTGRLLAPIVTHAALNSITLLSLLVYGY